METETKKELEVCDAMRRSLPKEYQKFVEMYLAGMSPGDAYIEAGLGLATATGNAQKARAILDTPRIRGYIESIERTIATRSLMTLEAVDQILADIATADVTDIIEMGTYNNDEGLQCGAVSVKDLSQLTKAQRAAIAKIKPIQTGGFEVTFHDKMKALEMLIKRRGGFTENQNVNLSGGVHIFAHVGDNGRGPRCLTSETIQSHEPVNTVESPSADEQ